MNTLDYQSKKRLKLDFNERSDSRPLWLSEVKITSKNYWKYPCNTELKDLIANRLQVQNDEILLTNGGDEAIELMLKWAKLNDYKIVLPLPAFSQYVRGVNTWKLKTNTIESLECFSIDQLKILDCIDYDSILIITSPNNPTGETLSIDAVTHICEQAQAKGAYVFLDCAYIEFSDQEGEYLDLINQFDNLLMLRTLSKAYGLAAIRVGFLLGQTKMINQFKELVMPFNLSQPNMDIAKAAFNQAASLEVKHYCQQIKKNREQLVSYLSRFNLAINNSQANFIFIRGKKKQLQLIAAACNQFNIQIKTKLIGLSKLSDVFAIRIGIPLYLERLLSALKLALEPELICFDMDGVLIDTSKSYDEAIIKTVEYFANITISTEIIVALRCKGGFNNDWKLTRELLKQQGVNVSLDEIINVFQKYYLGTESINGLYQNETRLISKEVSDLIFINKSKALKTAVVTGRGKEEAQQGLKQLALLNTLLVSNDEVDSPKPSPEGITKVKNYYQCHLTWMLGDTPDDIQAAKAAGAIAIAIGNETLYEFGADLVLDSVNELEDLL